MSSSTPAPSDASSAVVADLQNRIASLSAKLAPSQLNTQHAIAGMDDCITSDSGCCNTFGALTPYVAPPTTQSFFAPPATAAASGLLSFDDVSSVEVQACCGQNEAYTALMRCNGD